MTMADTRRFDHGAQSLLRLRASCARAAETGWPARAWTNSARIGTPGSARAAIFAEGTGAAPDVGKMEAVPLLHLQRA